MWLNPHNMSMRHIVKTRYTCGTWHSQPTSEVLLSLHRFATSAFSPSPTSSLSPAPVLCLFERPLLAPPSAALGPSDHSALLSWSISGRARNLSHISSLSSSMLPTASPPLPLFIACNPIRYVGPPTEKRIVWSYPQGVVLFGNVYPQTVR